MRAIRLVIPVVALVAGGWYFLSYYQIDGLEQIQVRPRGVSSDAVKWPVDAQAAVDAIDNSRTIRIATFDAGPLDSYKMQSPQIVARLADVIRQFDVVALQDVRARDHSLLISLLDAVNQSGQPNGKYDLVTDPKIGRVPVQRYMAFVFNSATMVVDRRAVYSVVDPAGRFECEPLAAPFAVNGLPAEQAFTFTLVSVCVSADRAEVEVPLLDDVFRAVRNDGRGEDDVIILGHIPADPSLLAQLESTSSGSWLIGGVPTSTRGGELADNLFLDRWATVEYTGRCGVMDLMRRFDLALHEAVATSANLPVWAEFSAFEGGISGIAARLSVPRNLSGVCSVR